MNIIHKILNYHFRNEFFSEENLAVMPWDDFEHLIRELFAKRFSKDGEEVKRFQADISFSMKATRKEMQEVIDELLMSDF